MKNPPNKSAVATILGAMGIAAGFGLLCATGSAQTTATNFSLLSVAASSQGLAPIASTEVPHIGQTWWWILPGGSAVPAPCAPLDFNGQIFAIGPNELILDVSGGDVNPRRFGLPADATDATIAAAANDEIQSLVGLITWIQAANQPTLTTATTMSLMANPMDGGGGGFSPDDQMQSGVPYLTIAPTGTNEFLITVLNDQGPANYELWWTPVLANPDYPWTAVAAGTTGQTNFIVPIPQFSTGFYQAIWDTNSVPTWEAAQPNNPSSGILTVFIDSPTNGAVIH